jgi:threonine dehydratase
LRGGNRGRATGDREETGVREATGYGDPDDVTESDVQAAAARIAPYVRRTPLEESLWLSQLTGDTVTLKLECWQPTGSFKVRGAFNAIASLGAAERMRGLVTASAGNHGQAVARAAARFGAGAVIFVPRSAPDAKKSRIRAYGATLDETSATYDDAEDAAFAYAREHGATFVHPYSDAAVVAGQGTIALEIIDEMPDVRNIIVPVGGGGMLAGMATVLGPRGVRVIGVQSDATPNMHAALEAGALVECPIIPTLADGLAGRTDALNVRRLQSLGTPVHLVPESSLAAAIRDLFVHDGVVAEGAGVVPVAALRTLALGLEGPTALVISGRNIDAPKLARMLAA